MNLQEIIDWLERKISEYKIITGGGVLNHYAIGKLSAYRQVHKLLTEIEFEL